MATAHAAPSTIADRRGRGAGAASIREPTATARIAAAAASSRARSRRPPSVPLASLLLPAGSMATRASPIAERSNRERAGTTRPSRHARRKARTSSAPSLETLAPDREGCDRHPRLVERVEGLFVSPSVRRDRGRGAESVKRRAEQRRQLDRRPARPDQLASIEAKHVQPAAPVAESSLGKARLPRERRQDLESARGRPERRDGRLCGRSFPRSRPQTGRPRRSASPSIRGPGVRRQAKSIVPCRTCPC